MPALPPAGKSHRLVVSGKVEPTFNTPGSEEFKLAKDPTVTDAEFQILEADNGKIFELVSDGTNWLL